MRTLELFLVVALQWYMVCKVTWAVLCVLLQTKSTRYSTNRHNARSRTVSAYKAQQWFPISILGRIGAADTMKRKLELGRLGGDGEAR